MLMAEDPHRVAAGSGEKNLLVVAPPGCGKTEFLALRADALVERLGPHQKILALTFTNKAKANLSERMRNVLGSQRARRYVRVRNFHGHATDIILAHGATIGLDVATLKLPDTKTMGKAIRTLTHGASNY